MEPRLEPHKEATPTLRLRSPVVRIQRERVMGFEDAPNREGNMRGRNAEGIRLQRLTQEKVEIGGVSSLTFGGSLGKKENSQPLRSSSTSVCREATGLLLTWGEKDLFFQVSKLKV
ncbi:hypothetical protein Tco_0409984 [Tanacetum coccineum]